MRERPLESSEARTTVSDAPPLVGRYERQAARRAGRALLALSVLTSLTASDLRARYGRGPSQLVKWLLDPFAVVGIYLVLASFLLGLPGRAPGLSIACAVVPFHLVMMSVISAMNAVHRRRAIVLNMAFERVLIPASSVITEAFAFVASLTLLAVMMVSYAVTPTAALVWLPVVLATNAMLALAFAYPASLFGLWFPDLQVLAASVVRTMFFLAPGLVPLYEIAGRAQDVVKLNPLTGLFESYRDVLLFGQQPAAWQLLYPTAFSLALLGVFLPVYRREQRHFAKVIE